MLLLEDRRFYTYIYLNPLKPGKYTYEGLDRSFLYEPFYVGKGKGHRMYDHIGNIHSKRDKNNYKKYIIKKILKNNKKPIIVKLYENLIEKEAYSLETHYIKTIGRINLKTGYLANLTDGGEGYVRLSAESKKRRIKNFLKTLKNNPSIMQEAIQRRKEYELKNPHIKLNRIIAYKKTLEENPDINVKRAQKVSKAIKSFSKDKKQKLKDNYLQYYIDDPNKKQRELEKRKQTFVDNPEIMLNRASTCRKTWENKSDEEKYQYSLLMSERQKNIMNNSERKEIRDRKSRETREKNPEKTKLGHIKSKETQIINANSLGSNNPNYKKIDIKKFLNFFFLKFSFKNVLKNYNENTNDKISMNIVKRISLVYHIPTWNNSNAKEGIKRRKEFIEFYKNKIEILVDLYEPLEQIYYLTLNKNRHPELNLEYYKDISNIINNIQELEKKQIIEDLVSTKNFY